MASNVKTLEWKNEELLLIDQRKLPHVETYVHCRTLEDCWEAINVMVVRGAPLIGFTAIWGVALWLKNNASKSFEDFSRACDYLITSRPTAVNLAYETNRCRAMAKEYYEKNSGFKGLYEVIQDFAHSEMDKLHRDNMTMAKLAEKELTEKFGNRPLRLMTLCNTGFLACGPMGTALGVISHMHSIGRVEIAYASETRPYLQGGRLTAFELKSEGINHKVVAEGAHSYMLREGLVDAIFIGADRIVSNGDTANKVGSSSLAIIANYYGVPFYVVAPTSSFDLHAKTGKEIEIEMRPEEEVLSCQGVRIAPEGSRALNPSFDVTENKLIEGIFCEKGIIKPVNTENLLSIVKK